MENSGSERRVDDATDRPAATPTLLDVLITRLADPAAVLDDSLTVVSANDSFTALAGARRRPVGEPLTELVPALTSDDIERTIERTDDYCTVRTAASPERWTEFGFDRRGSHVLCIGRNVSKGDVSEPPVTETLAPLQTATRELLGAQTREAVAERIVETATDVLGLSGATLYLFDACRNVLWPAGIAGAPGGDAREAVGGDDGGVLREVFLEGVAATSGDGDRYRPLGDYGVFHTVADGDWSADRREGADTAELVDYLAESARAALERVDREAMLRERDASHREQAERVDELERILSVVRRVQGALVDADSVSDIEQSVCDALTESTWLSFAWIGRTDGDGVEPRAWSGRRSDYLESVSLSTADPDAPPAVQTAVSDEPTTVDAVAEDIRERHWRTAAIGRDLQSVVSVPLRSDGVGYGVLTAYANQPVDWEGQLSSVFVELGASVATAVRDRERRSRLTADTRVELDLTVPAPDAPLCRLAATLGTTVCCSETIPGEGGTTRLFFSVPGVEPDEVAEAVDRVQHLGSLATISSGDRYELLADERTVVGRVFHHGGRLESAYVTDGEMRLTATLAADADVRTFVDRLGDSCSDVQLTARRHQSAPAQRRGGIRDSLEAALTDRQLEALHTAYSSGFFEWPRETTGEGVAEMLGVAQPTVNRHLRVSQRKLLELVFDEELHT